MLRLVTAQTLFGLVVDLVLSVGLALITYVAARRALSGAISVGEVLVVITYTGSLYAPISGFAANFGQLKAAAAAAQRVFQVLDEEPPSTRRRAVPPSPRAEGRIAFEEVVFGYRPDKPVLRSVEFSAAPGQVVAVVGPTGAGKSSIASLLLRLYDPDGGRVTLDGADLRELPLGWLREQVAFVPQEPVLLASTLLENIRYGRLDAGDDEVHAAAEAANLGEFLEDAHGLDVTVGDRGVMLSGGQRQRVAIARAMLKDAPVLVLDEPTSALDAGTEAGVMEAVERLFSDRTVLVIAHRLATVERADQVLVVERGQIVQRGTHVELAQRSGRYRALHESRFGSTTPFPRAAG
jgi:ATP-binding cassette subfamily B protein/subfamily B ATP-binding cassette protein MsbA